MKLHKLDEVLQNHITKEIEVWHTLNEDDQLEEALAILQSLPIPARVKLILFLTHKTPELLVTKFFLEFCKQNASVKI